jgi:NAD(P)-dependent dehydrogenase (short-subunit alcohol dehydrogenase family)
MVSDTMQGKVAIITGAASGIGRATAVGFAERGSAVGLVDRDSDGLEKTVAQVHEAGGEAIARTADVTVEADVEQAIAAVVERFGRLDFAFNNAGTTGVFGLGAILDQSAWDAVVGTNLTGVFLSMKHEIAEMLRHGGGAIVNCSSAAGLIGTPFLPAYSASKSGVIGLTRSWALDYIRQGIRINAVCPGAVDTPMIRSFVGGNEEMLAGIADQQPIGRLARPEEIAKAVVWLLSDEASYIVGHALAVDGGTVVA